MKFIIVSGGVLSGLGKGVIASSIGLLLKSHGIKVTTIKCDMYLNIDAGTMNPIEHGEVFVTHDGLETDQDLGHYERFLNTSLSKENYLTNGQIYKYVLEKERSLEYDGVCVQPYHHIPPEIIKRWKKAGKIHKAQVVIIEMGGTVGEYEGLLFFEAVRRLKLDNPKEVCIIHVGYLPAPPSIGELKSKPIQQSVSQLNSLGLQPDIIVGRGEKKIDKKRKEKIALASGLSPDDIVSAEDVKCIYSVPLLLKEQKMDYKILKILGLKKQNNDLKKWKEIVVKQSKLKKEVKIGIIGKYQKTGDYTLEDSYVCVLEAVKHASWKNNVKPKFIWINSEKLEKMSENEVSDELSLVNGIIVPQGWGKRGVEGKVKAIEFARKNMVPYLGLCFGMQMAVIEFARNVMNLKDANTEEVDPKTKYPVIHIMPEQKMYLSNKQYGGTIRLGAWPCLIKKGTKVERAYKKYGNNISAPWYEKNRNIVNGEKPKKAKLIYERHRHRYEFNNKYRKRFESNGLIVSGLSPDLKLVEAIELENHPFFVGTQFHPEYLSRLLNPHPIFISFIESLI